jgi:hypothetical protein
MIDTEARQVTVTGRLCSSAQVWATRHNLPVVHCLFFERAALHTATFAVTVASRPAHRVPPDCLSVRATCDTLSLFVPRWQRSSCPLESMSVLVQTNGPWAQPSRELLVVGYCSHE